VGGGGGGGEGIFFKLNYYILKDIFSFFAFLECGGIYEEASHCWPFNTSLKILSGNVVSEDLKGDRQASLKVSRNFVNFFTRL